MVMKHMCSKSGCGVIVRIEKCKSQISAKLLFDHGTDKREQKSLYTYGERVGKLACVSVPKIRAVGIEKN